MLGSFWYKGGMFKVTIDQAQIGIILISLAQNTCHTQPHLSHGHRLRAWIMRESYVGDNKGPKTAPSKAVRANDTSGEEVRKATWSRTWLWSNQNSFWRSMEAKTRCTMYRATSQTPSMISLDQVVTSEKGLVRYRWFALHESTERRQRRVQLDVYTQHRSANTVLSCARKHGIQFITFLIWCMTSDVHLNFCTNNGIFIRS